MKKYDFVAVDFETATNSRMICQIGIAAVVNDEIVDEVDMLVQPPCNHYDNNVKIRHHVREADTFDKPTFDQIWPDINKYFYGQTIISHTPFDSDALFKTLTFYGLCTEDICFDIDTCQLNGGKKLEVCCAKYGIPCENHHDALNDAICCAKLYIANRKEGFDRSAIFSAKTNFSEPNKKRERIDGKYYIKNLDDAPKDSPFYDKKVVVTGVFEHWTRKEIVCKLWHLGADVDTSISKKTNAVIVGKDYGETKREKWEKLQHDGFNIAILKEKDLLRIFSGEYEAYRDIGNIKKSLNFTMNHYTRNRIVFDGMKNVISLKNIYVGGGLAGSSSLMMQMAGNLGASSDTDIWDGTNICLLSDSTLNKLKAGEKDDTINYIEKTYNESKAIVFDFKFLCESDLLDYIKSRCDSYNDEILRQLLDKYKLVR